MIVLIPLEPVPNQKISIVLNNQTCQISVYERGDYLYLDLYIDGVVVFTGFRCIYGEVINTYPSVVNGFLAFYTKDGLDPKAKDIGTSAFLLYGDGTDE
jgi:hypothetical protein